MSTLKKVSIKAISFDWDGVLTIHGETLKQMAWDNLSAKESEAFKQALRKERYQFSGGGGSRYDIIRQTLRAIGCLPKNLEESMALYATRYQNEVMKLMETDIRPEARTLLSEWATQFPLYVNSATAEDGLCAAAKRLGLTNFFKEIYGYPVHGAQWGKDDTFRLILKKEGIKNPKELLHVGDGASDVGAVRVVNCSFVGMANSDNNWSKDTVAFPLITSLSELSAFL